MVTQEQFELIKRKHGQYASWAVWAPAGSKPTSHVGDLDVLDPVANPGLLDALNPSIVMLGLNISRPLMEPFSNFHDKRPQAKDYKIRHAFEGTRYCGAYMTDVLKFFVEADSSTVMSAVRKRPGNLESSATILREEIRDLGCGRPEIIAFGADAASLARLVLDHRDYSRLVRVTHYSYYGAKENYRREVLAQCSGLDTGKRMGSRPTSA